MMHTNRGFIIAEIIISIAIMVFVAVPILTFVLGANQNKILQKFTNHYTQYISKDVTVAMVNASSSTSTSKLINEYGFSNSCNTFFAHVFSKLNLVTFNNDISVGSQDILNHIQVSYPDYPGQIFASTSNSVTSLEMINDMQKKYLIVGSNSASTTDFDLSIFDVRNDMFANAQTFDLGPGVIDMARNQSEIYIAQRSLATPLVSIHTQSLITGYISHTLQRESFSNIASSTIRNGYPLVLKSTDSILFVGTEKNPYSELYALDMNNKMRVAEREINAGVNTIEFKDNLVYIASPKNPELEVYLLSASSSGMYDFALHDVFDAPGSSGNGKSVFVNDKNIYLGRTVGNNEVFVLYSNLTNVTEPYSNWNIYSMNPNQSITRIEPIFDGRFILTSTNTSENAIVLWFDQDTKIKHTNFSWFGPSQTFNKLLTLPLQGIPRDILCDSTSMYIGTDNPRYPIALISVI